MFLKMMQHWLFGVKLFDVEGSSGTGTGQDKPDDKTPPADDKKFTQADVDRIVGERAQRAAESAVSKLLDGLSIKSPDELKTLITDKRKADADKLSETEKLAKAKADLEAKLTNAEQAGQEAIAKANLRLMKAAVITEASKPDYRIKPDARDDVWRFIESDEKLKELIKLKDGSEDDYVGVDAAIKSLLKAKTYLVETGNGTPRQKQGSKTDGNAERPKLGIRL